MNLLKQINEDACGASSIGVVAMPLFSQLVRQSKTTKQPTPKVIQYKKTSRPKQERKSLGLREAVSHLFEDDMPTDQQAPIDDSITNDAISKLKSLENGEKQDKRDTVTFGLDDDDRGCVRVTVRSDQAEEFEKALEAVLTNEDDEELPEIAELLYKLKDKFDIVDVEWPEVEEDEETDQALDGGGDMGGDAGGDPAGMELGGDDLDLGGDMTPPPESNPQDLLTQVIDMMKADAEARKADARAREAEAKNREAEAAIGQAQARVKQEEELLDMDTYNKNKKEEDKEAKRLAQLAQWRQEVANQDGGEADDDFGLGQSIRGQENEERTTRPTQTRVPRQQVARPAVKQTTGGRVHPHDIARFILNRMK